MTVPVDEAPPVTELEARLRPFKATSGVIVRPAVADAPPEVAVTTAVVSVETEAAVIAKVAVVVPGGTATKDGTIAAASLTCRPTTSPPAGAG